jgi:hypothetical protein
VGCRRSKKKEYSDGIRSFLSSEIEESRVAELMRERERRREKE